MTPTEQVSDGMAVIENMSDRPVRLISIEPVFDAGPGTDIVLGVHLVQRRADEQLFALTRSYPPDGPLAEVRDAVLEPSRVGGAQYQVIIGLRLRTGTVTLTALRVTYRIGEQEYATVLPHSAKLCTGQPMGAMSCTDPGVRDGG